MAGAAKKAAPAGAAAHSPEPWSVVPMPAKGDMPRMVLVATGGPERTDKGQLRQAIDCTNSGASHAEDIANATVIAAAPRMLRELRVIADALPSDDGYAALDAVVRFQRIARAAIEEATGPAGR